MGNDNSDIPLYLENKNFIKNKNNNTQNINNISKIGTNSKNKNQNIQSNQRVPHKYFIHRTSATPDRELKFHGISNENNEKENKRGGSYDKITKSTSSNSKKQSDISFIGIKKKYRNNNDMINRINNFINSIYNYGIDKEISKIEFHHSGTKNLNFNGLSNNNNLNNNDNNFDQNDKLNFIFDSVFKYSFYNNNYNNNLKKGRKKNQNNKGISPHKSSIYFSNNYEEINNKSNKIINNNLINKPKIDKNEGTQNTTLILNKYDPDNEVISINNRKNKKFNNFKNNNNQRENYYKNDNDSKNTKTESESLFMSSEEIEIINNIDNNLNQIHKGIQKVEIKNFQDKKKEEDMTDSDENIILTEQMVNKYNQKRNNHLAEQNNCLSINRNDYKNGSEFGSGSKNYQNKNRIQPINISNNEMSSAHKKKEKSEGSDIINLSTNKKEDENNTYMELLTAMNESKKSKKNERIFEQKYQTNQRQNTPDNIFQENTQKNMAKIKKSPIRTFPINNINKTNINYTNGDNTNNQAEKRKMMTRTNNNDIYKSLKFEGTNSNNKLNPSNIYYKGVNQEKNIYSKINNNYINNKIISEPSNPSHSTERCIPNLIRRKTPLGNLSKSNNKNISNENTPNNKKQKKSKDKNIINYSTNSNTNNYNNYLHKTITNGSNNNSGSKKPLRASGKNKVLFMKKNRIAGNSFDTIHNYNNNNNLNKDKENDSGEGRTKSNDQKYIIYNSKNVIPSGGYNNSNKKNKYK